MWTQMQWESDLSTLQMPKDGAVAAEMPCVLEKKNRSTNKKGKINAGMRYTKHWKLIIRIWSAISMFPMHRWFINVISSLDVTPMCFCFAFCCSEKKKINFGDLLFQESNQALVMQSRRGEHHTHTHKKLGRGYIMDNLMQMWDYQWKQWVEL